MNRVYGRAAVPAPTQHRARRRQGIPAGVVIAVVVAVGLVVIFAIGVTAGSAAAR